MMKRLNLLMAMLLMVLAGAWAQTSQRAVHRVQGIERADLTVPQVMNQSKDGGGTGICLDSIKFWVGKVNPALKYKRAALAVKWHDGNGYTNVHVWGYKFQGNKTGADMIAEVAKTDPRFYYLVYGGTWSYTDSLHTDSIFTGDAIGGIGFDPTAYSHNMSLVLNGQTYPLVQGAVHTNAYNFDDWTSTANNGYWNSGWYRNGYWSYWNAANVGSSYGYASTGCSGRTLTDGCVDGWVFANDFDWDADMGGNIIYVPARIPLNTEIPNKAPKKTKTRAAGEGKTYTVFSIQELEELVWDSEDGDIFQFDESLRGKVLDCTGSDGVGFGNGTKNTVLGNGVILSNAVCFGIANGSDVTIKDIIFDNPEEDVIFISSWEGTFGNATIENCTFRNCQRTGRIFALVGNNDPIEDNDYTVTVRNCLFDNNILRDENYNYSGPMMYFGGYAFSTNSKDYTVKLINNTFRGNKLQTEIINSANKVGVELYNNVFEENVLKKGDGYVINIGENSTLSSSYNVISGTISEVYQSQLSETDKWAVDLETSLEDVDGQWQVKKDSPAYHNVPAEAIVFDEDGCPTLMGVKLPTTDIYGNAIDYTKPLQAGCSQAVVGGDVEEPQAIDYTQGTFLLNEDWYGHQNSTINFLTEEGEMLYRVIQRENEGVQLGCTAQYGTIYGGKMYITSKQEKDPGAKVTGGRLTICDARTMKVEKQFQTITANGYKGKADGRAFLGVNEHKGYMGTSNGIFILDLDELEFTDFIKVPNDDEDLYTGQVGNMVRAGDYVFANHQNAGLLVIDPETDQIVKALKPNDALVSTMTLANDGNLWLMSGGKLVKLDPYTLEMETIELPSNVRTTSEGWGAWRASTFCASRQQNALFWVSADGALEDKGDVIFKYDIDKGEVSHYLQLPEAEEWSIYGSGFRIDPVTDEAIMCLFKTYGNNSYITRKYNAQGEKILELEMEKNYWFPALPIYPDNAAPVVTPLDAQTVALGETAEISLADLAEDADNMTASIIKTVKAVSDSEVLSASIKGGKLLLEGLAEGTATVTIQVNSNGQLAETEVEVTVFKTVADFEDLALEPESYWAGDEDGEEAIYGMASYNTFTSGVYEFDNYYMEDYDSWMGYAYSNQTSTEFAGLADQYKSCVGSGVNGSANYVVAYPDASVWGVKNFIKVQGEPRVVPGFYITNSAYAINSMTKGDAYAGDPFTVGDFYKITIHAVDAEGEEIATRDFCLADYRFENAEDRYMVTDWTYVDLSQLGAASAFYFSFDGSRKSGRFLNTPTYFCIDDFGAEGEETVREEGTFDGKATSVTLDAEELALTIGETATLTATVAPEAAVDKTVTWTSSNEAVATVDAAGVVTAVAAGEVTITATCGELTATCTVTVNKKSQTIEWEQEIAEMIEVGTEITLTATSTAGLDITYELTAGAEFATLNGNVLTILADGHIEITATQAGNDEYAAAEPVVKVYDLATGIAAIASDRRAATIYTLDGKRIEKITQKGIYIINGKKTLVK